MIVYLLNGSVLLNGGAVAVSPDCCCCTDCGLCQFNTGTSVTVTWSFSIDPAAVDLNGSGQTWAMVPSPIPDEFADVASGSVTLSPAVLINITGGGTGGNTFWSQEFTAPDSRTYVVTIVYDCAANGWGFVVSGPGDAMFLSHDDNPGHANHPIGLMSGSCSGASGSDAIFQIDGPGNAEFLATGTVSVVVHNPCM